METNVKSQQLFFFDSGIMLAQMFTEENREGKFMHDPILDKQFPGCMKPIEYFSNDIRTNLVQWTTTGKDAQTVVYYKTTNYWYVFEQDRKHAGLIWMRRFGNQSWARSDSWANKSSISDLGNDWLKKPEQLRKYVKFADGENSKFVTVCPGCNQMRVIGYGGVCLECDTKEVWIDPAGGVHHGYDGDPAAMYK